MKAKRSSKSARDSQSNIFASKFSRIKRSDQVATPVAMAKPYDRAETKTTQTRMMQTHTPTQTETQTQTQTQTQVEKKQQLSVVKQGYAPLRGLKNTFFPVANLFLKAVAVSLISSVVAPYIPVPAIMLKFRGVFTKFFWGSKFKQSVLKGVSKVKAALGK